jgi:RNA polymerase sigma factor (TIGR02999 family)
MVYEDLRKHAAARITAEWGARTLQPTALVHEAWLRVVGRDGQVWENRAHFFGAVSEAMRRILIEHARNRARMKRGGGQLRVDIDSVELAEARPEERILLIDEALELLGQADPEKARIVVLKFFGGYTNRDIADNLGVTERTIERQWAFAKAWLYRAVKERDG